MSKQELYETYPIKGLSDETLFRALTDFNPDVVLFVTDLTTYESVWSDNAIEFFDYPEDYLKRGEELTKERVHPDDYQYYINEITAIYEGRKTSHFFQYRIANSKGEYSWIQCSGTVRIDPYSKKRFFIGSILRLNKTGIYDPLTKLLSMDHFLAMGTHKLQREHDQASYRIIYFDIKNFKMQNIENGLENGNHVLCQAAGLLESHFPDDLISRFSGDRFVVLTKAEDPVPSIEAVQQEFSLIVENHELQLKAGLYPIHNKQMDLARACDLAKAALDEIKSSEQNIYQYDSKLQRKLTLERYILQSVDLALKEGWIQVYYQPVIRTLTGAVCGFEALARWVDPHYGFLSPSDFIPVLETAGQVVKIDQYVIREVCRQIRSCLDSSIPIAPVSVNLSRVDIVKCDIAADIHQIATEYRIPQKLLNIEITESVAVSDFKRMQRCVKQFHDMGYQVWMDDFGSGYSSLNVLQYFDFDKIKLDMEFMQNFNDTSKKLVMSFVTTAKKMGLTTLTEGVETQEQLDFLKRIGCEKAQGFLISRPQPFDRLLQQLAKQNLHIETKDEDAYYGKVNAIDFVTEHSLAISEYDGQMHHFLFHNDSFAKDWNLLDIGQLQPMPGNIAENHSAFWVKYRSVLAHMTDNQGFHEMDYTVHGYYLRLRTRCLSRHEHRILCQLEIVNVTKLDDDKETNDYIKTYREQELTRSILDQLPCAVVVFSRSKDGVLTRKYISSYTRIFTGKDDAHDADQTEIMSIVHPDDLPWVQKRVAETIRANQGMDETYRVVSAQGKVSWVHHTANAVPQPDGSCTFYAIYYDLTEQKELEERQKSALSKRYGNYFKHQFDANSLGEVLSVVNLQSSMLTSIANTYIAMYIANLEDDSFLKISCLEYVERLVHQFRRPQAALDHIIDVMISPESQEEAHRFMDLSTLPDRLVGKKVISLDYNGAVTGWCRGQIIPVSYTARGQVKEVLFIVQQIQSEKLKEEKLRKQAERDGFSQLYNRVSGEAYINALLQKGHTGIFCLFDVDHFKHYNDTYGHAAGDEIIRRISHCMQTSFRDQDILMRIGGDEFGIYVSDVQNETIGCARIHEFSESIKAIQFDAFDESVSVSTGAVFCREHEYLSFDQIYQIADARMYEHKKARKEKLRT